MTRRAIVPEGSGDPRAGCRPAILYAEILFAATEASARIAQRSSDRSRSGTISVTEAAASSSGADRVSAK